MARGEGARSAAAAAAGAACLGLGLRLGLALLGRREDLAVSESLHDLEAERLRPLGALDARDVGASGDLLELLHAEVVVQQVLADGLGGALGVLLLLRDLQVELDDGGLLGVGELLEQLDGRLGGLLLECTWSLRMVRA